MSLLYIFIAIWVSVNGISSPFDDALSFFMWAAVLVPVIAGISLLLHSDDDRKN
jgi:ABC-type multidrug transport system permease subunit